MARTRKKNKKIGRSGKIALYTLAALLLFLCAVLAGAAINASILHVRRSEIVIPDLPAAFDGVKLLYASDIDLCGLNTATKSGELINQLQSLSPDVLILGGDYNSSSVFDRLNRPESESQTTTKMLQQRSDFFHYISSFYAPLGKYAVASPEDGDLYSLEDVMTQCDIHPLFNDRAAIFIGNQTLWLAGLCTDSLNVNSAGHSFEQRDCVISVCHSPSVLPMLLTSEAADGGSWVDLVLCGHTHGGQIRIFGKSILQLNRVEEQYLSGWKLENSLPILTTQGIGCEGANLRLGTEPEVWLITLRRQ